MFEDFLNHTCDIFHLVEQPSTEDYGIKVAKQSVYEKEPSEKDVPCHFHIQSDGIKLIQEEPYRRLSGEIKVSLPIGTNIRKNDRVQSKETGLCYLADVPRNIREHHIIVQVRREEGVKGAI